MAANQYGIDMADIYRTTTAVKGARTQNALSNLKLQEQERVIAERPEKERLAAERQNMLTGLRGKAVAGDVSAQQQLLAVDPEGGAKFMQAVGSMDQTQLDNAKRSVDEMGKLSAFVIQSKDPQKAYQTMRAGVSPEAQAKLPEQYDPEFMQMSLTKSMAMDKILENPKSISVGTEDVVYQRGQEIERSAKPVKDGKGGKGGKGGGGLKSADESLMYKQSVELLGGIFDEAGNITNLDPTTRNKVQRIATEAANEFVRRGDITRTEAVTRAAKKFGMSIPTDTGAQYTEGQRITNPSTGETMIMSNGKWVSTAK
jgi:hypothetical protein